MARAFKILRRGYPNLPIGEQCKGREFREAAQDITDELVKFVLKRIPKKSKITVLLPWRSALAFAPSFLKFGIKNFYHLSSKRDEKTLKTIVDYEKGKLDARDAVIVADPMLATGNTIVDAVGRMLGKGISAQNIIVLSVIAAPEGVAKVRKNYPKVKIILGVLDKKLDKRGYIVPGLGDFGDKYFAELSKEEFWQIINSLKPDSETREKLIDRIKKQGMEEVYHDLIERDRIDKQTDHSIEKELLRKGLKTQKTKRLLVVDSTKIEGITKRVNYLMRKIRKNEKIITIEGVSGAGKSSTTDALVKKLHGIRFSMGEVFRYLTYLTLKKKAKDYKIIASKLHYQLKNKEIQLWEGATNISQTLKRELRSNQIDQNVALVASKTQEVVIRFAARQIAKMAAETDTKIFIEGRGYTLNFLPSDLRIKLTADPWVRAERRWEDKFLK